MQVMTDNIKPATMNDSNGNVKSSRGKRRFQISDSVLSRINDFLEQLPPDRGRSCTQRALLGLLYEGYSQAGSILISFGRLSVGPEDLYRLCWIFDMGRRFSSFSISNECTISFHTNTKTMLLLFLAGSSERLVDRPNLVSELFAAAGSVHMPFLFRIALRLQKTKMDLYEDDENGVD